MTRPGGTAIRSLTRGDGYTRLGVILHTHFNHIEQILSLAPALAFAIHQCGITLMLPFPQVGFGRRDLRARIC